ncbi:restriction endonuclease subunit S [Shimia aestuarii]|uniref:Type I restriction enzyme, S subunit n=1 Tax=Shimia aestuarii TaxID=254406 RepID=A0A1I4ITG4_9RHOB|nr:restriction endonuclease subunit S [Shimia aestuarii]SFL57367.1 type I restriction enzyme, S subunit [Shimia aestuarii]
MKDIAEFGWPTKPLGDLVDVLDRLRKPITKKDRKAGPYPYYGATGVLDHVDGYLFDEPLVLIGEDGAKWEAGANSAFAIEGKTWVNNHAHVIRPHRDQVLDGWLIYYLNGADLMPFISGMTVPKLNQGRLREIPIPLPPLEEQQRIVAVLDEAFEGLVRARAHAEANLQNAQELLKSARSVALDPPETQEGWHRLKLGDVATLQRGFDLPKRLRTRGRFPLVTSSGPTDTHSQAKVKGPGVVTGRSGSIGNVFFIEEDFWPLNTALYVKDFHGNEPRFVFHMLKSFNLARFASGAGVPTLNRNDVHYEVVELPKSRDAQKKIVEHMDAISEQIGRAEVLYEAKLQDLEDLRQSLVQKAFAGELT